MKKLIKSAMSLGVLLVSVTAFAAQGPAIIGWPNFPNQLPDGDEIHATTRFDPALGTNVRVVLRLGGNLNWDKQVNAYNHAGQPVRFADVHDQVRESSYELPACELGLLMFQKAKTFGVHTDVYAMPVNVAPGTELTFTWTRD